MSVTEKSFPNWKELPAGRDEAPTSLSLAAFGSTLKGLGKLGLLGLGLLVFCGWLLLKDANHLIHGQRTNGVVVGHEQHHRARSGTSYAPIVEYTVEGQHFRVVGRTSTDLDAYKINQLVSVLYLPDEPARGLIADFMQLYLLSTLTGISGAFCIGVSWATSVRANRSDGRATP